MTAVPQAAVDAAQQVLSAHSVALALRHHACAECGFAYEDWESWSRHRAEAVAAAVVAAQAEAAEAKLRDVEAERDALRAEVERQRDLAQRNFKQGAALLVELQAAEAKLRDAEAERDALRAGMEGLAEHWHFDGWATYEGRDVPKQDGWTLDQCAVALDAVLARSQAPQAPAEQDRCPTCGKARDDLTPGPHAEGWGVCPESFHFRAPSAPPATADDEEVRRG